MESNSKSHMDFKIELERFPIAPEDFLFPKVSIPILQIKKVEV